MWTIYLDRNAWVKGEGLATADTLAAAKARADELGAELAATREQAAQWQREAEGHAAALDSARADLAGFNEALKATELLASMWRGKARIQEEKRTRTAARLKATRAALAASRSDAAAALALASEGEARLADALGRLATAERSRADLATALARTRAQSPLAGLSYINPPHRSERFHAAA